MKPLLPALPRSGHITPSRPRPAGLPPPPVLPSRSAPQQRVLDLRRR